MTLELWRPKRMLRPFDWTVRDWFDDFLERGRMFPTISRESGFNPSMESYIKNNMLHLRAELPGVDPKDVDVSLHDGYLTITGERKKTHSEEDTCYCVEEFSYGRFSRTLSVPEGVDSEKITASFDSGILEVTVPLPEREAEKKIPISGKKVEGKHEKAA